jgi:hypothetical protein
MLVSLSCTSNPPCTMGNRFCLSGLLLAFMQRSSQRVVRYVASSKRAWSGGRGKWGVGGWERGR